ncbi:MAG: protease inhibitor I42 family protein [Deltaproteobacteria bacterium]|nr:protease inhibitor I42 family protein [Deltaproteobacteria bacterium]
MYKLSLIFLIVSFSASAPVSVKLAEKDLGRTVELGIGETLEVELRGNPTTGYVWDIASLDMKILKQIGETEFTPDRKGRGVGGKVIMRFKAQGAGETLLKLIYHRRFEKERPPTKTFEATIIVK